MCSILYKFSNPAAKIQNPHQWGRIDREKSSRQILRHELQSRIFAERLWSMNCMQCGHCVRSTAAHWRCDVVRWCTAQKIIFKCYKRHLKIYCHLHSNLCINNVKLFGGSTRIDNKFRTFWFNYGNVIRSGGTIVQQFRANYDTTASAHFQIGQRGKFEGI